MGLFDLFKITKPRGTAQQAASAQRQADILTFAAFRFRSHLHTRSAGSCTFWHFAMDCDPHSR